MPKKAGIGKYYCGEGKYMKTFLKMNQELLLQQVNI